MLSIFPVILFAVFTASVAETDVVKTLADHLTRLESKMIGLEAREEKYKHKIQELEKEVSRLGQVVANTGQENHTGLTETKTNRQRRASELVAFTAYLSANFDGEHFGTGHTVKYDVIETNEGNGYNKFTGTFTAPSDGIYAFTWTIKAAGRIGDAKHGEITVELVKNSVVKGVINADSEQDYDDACSTALVIVSLSAGDVVFTRSAPFEQPQGILSSDGYGRWTFSGWRLF
ncbi:C1q-related factor-like [Mytilus galloprovincialis]|uniref:C1q-related factor-like n=1 Tax=Mytilus edulis TaxID=6550 RepID=UPI0039F0D207